MTTLPIEPDLFWGMIWTTGLLLALLLVFGAFPRDTHHIAPLERFQARLNLDQINPGLFLVGLLMWALIFGLLFAGLLGLIWEMLWISQPIEQPDHSKASEEKPTFSDWRFTLAKLTATTAVLAAVVAFPVTLIRLGLTRKQTDTAQEALFNDKISAASEDLYAIRQRWNGAQNIWEDDVVKRNVALLRLEDLATEYPDTAPRIARTLSAYLRELSKTIPPVPAPPIVTENSTSWADWVSNLEVCRADMEIAAQVLGRLRNINGVKKNQITIDLRGANLQKFDLTGLDFCEANLSGASLDGALLSNGRLRKAELFNANFVTSILNGADLEQAHGRGCKFVGTNLSGANLSRSRLPHSFFLKSDLTKTQLSNAILSYATLDENSLLETNLGKADLSNASLKSTRFLCSNLKEAKFSSAKLREAEFVDVCAKGANFMGANLRSARFTGSSLAASKFTAAQMEGVAIVTCTFDNQTDLKALSFRGGYAHTVDFSSTRILQEQADQLFYDGTVLFSTSIRRTDDQSKVLTPDEFTELLQLHINKIGYDPEDPRTWTFPTS